MYSEGGEITQYKGGWMKYGQEREVRHYEGERMVVVLREETWYNMRSERRW